MSNAALEYHRRGWSVVPLRPRTKKPIHEDWQITNLTEDQIRTAFRTSGEGSANIGVLLGTSSGNLVDSDLDCPMAVQLAPHFLPESGAVFGRAQKRSSHRLYIANEKFSFKKYTDPTPKGYGNLIELRGDGHQTMLPGSIHPDTGETIEWEILKNPTSVEIDRLVESHNELAAATLLALYWPTSSRHFAALHLSGGLLRARWSVEKVEDFIRAILIAAGDEEAHDRIRTIRDTAERLERGEEFTGFPSLAEIIGDAIVSRVRHWLGISGVLRSYTFTDQGNAERLVNRHGQDIRYVHAWKQWLIWNGRQWVKDDTDEIMRRAKDTAQAIYLEAASYTDSSMQKACSKWAIRSGDAGKLNAMVRLAQSEVPITPDQLDADPLLVNCRNGTLDLRTGGLREHRREDFITKITTVSYDPSASAPTWTRFLERVIEDPAVRLFLQKAVGYSMTGMTSEDCFFIPWGSGRNGKSTFLETIKTILGDYAASTGAQTFMEKRGGGIPSDLAALVGARFVSAAETDTGHKLSDSLIKQITGGDVVQARFMYADFFTFTPTFKVWIATNNKPIINSSTRAIWERVRLVPFTVTIPREERDPKLRERLGEDEAAGIFTWMVRGAIRWLEEGLSIPEAVEEATESYREEMDDLAEFLDNHTYRDDSASCSAANLHRHYAAWAKRNNVDVISIKAFKAEMEGRGFKTKRTASGVQWVGIDIAKAELDEGNPFGTP